MKIDYLINIKINEHFLKHYELLLKYFEDYLIAFDNILLVFLIIMTIDYRHVEI
jgi:hypothetical protein